MTTFKCVQRLSDADMWSVTDEGPAEGCTSCLREERGAFCWRRDDLGPTGRLTFLGSDGRLADSNAVLFVTFATWECFPGMDDMLCSLGSGDARERSGRRGRPAVTRRLKSVAE